MFLIRAPHFPPAESLMVGRGWMGDRRCWMGKLGWVGLALGHGMLLTRVVFAVRRAGSKGRSGVRVHAPCQKHGTPAYSVVLMWIC